MEAGDGIGPIPRAAPLAYTPLHLAEKILTSRYRQALALAEELGIRPLQAQCHRSLGTLYARLGQWEQARPVLGAALDLYRAMAMTFWLPQVEATLAQRG